MKKVIFAASSGGHLTEILKLEKLFNEYNYLLVTEKTDVTDKLKDKYNVKFLKYGPCKNKIKYVLTIIYNIFCHPPFFIKIILVHNLLMIAQTKKLNFVDFLCNKKID